MAPQVPASPPVQDRVAASERASCSWGALVGPGWLQGPPRAGVGNRVRGRQGLHFPSTLCGRRTESARGSHVGARGRRRHMTPAPNAPGSPLSLSQGSGTHSQTHDFEERAKVRAMTLASLSHLQCETSPGTETPRGQGPLATVSSLCSVFFIFFLWQGTPNPHVLQLFYLICNAPFENTVIEVSKASLK